MKWHAPNFLRLQLKNAIMRRLNVHLLLTRSWKALQIVQLPKALAALQFFTGGRSNLPANISIKRNMRSLLHLFWEQCSFYFCRYQEKSFKQLSVKEKYHLMFMVWLSTEKRYILLPPIIWLSLWLCTGWLYCKHSL